MDASYLRMLNIWGCALVASAGEYGWQVCTNNTLTEFCIQYFFIFPKGSFMDLPSIS